MKASPIPAEDPWKTETKPFPLRATPHKNQSQSQIPREPLQHSRTPHNRRLKQHHKASYLVSAPVGPADPLQKLNMYNTLSSPIQKQSPRAALKKRCSENMQQIYLKQLYSNRTSAWVFPWKFAAYFSENLFLRGKGSWAAASAGS